MRKDRIDDIIDLEKAGKKDISKLVPVKKIVTRNGRQLETTVYVSREEAKQMEQGKKQEDPKQPKGKKGEYYIYMKGTGYEKVDGKQIKINDDFHTFIHKDSFGNFVVSEATTGMKLVHSKKRKNAIEQAKDLLERNKDRAKQLVEQYVKENGKSPWAEGSKKEDKPTTEKKDKPKDSDRVQVKDKEQLSKLRKQLGTQHIIDMAKKRKL